MESSVDPSLLQSMSLPPTLSDLRIVLLGKNSSEISRVGNFILGREAFDPEAPPPSVEQHSERAGGTVEGRYITLINTPHLFDPQLSLTKLNQRVRECVSLCSPGPHVLVLVLQPDDFTEADRHRLDYILHSLTEEPYKHTLVVTTQQLQSDSSVDPAKEEVSQEVILKCSNRHLEFSSECSRSDLVEMMEKMVEENGGSHLQSGIVVGKNIKEKWSQRLNLVLCGSDGAVKSSISDLILGQRELSPESSSACVRREGEVCGCLITLVELPALYNTQLSEEEVMRETLRCVSLCGPGVHAFLLILPEGRLTDEDKGEVEKIQMIFGSRFNHHTIALINTEAQQGAVKSDAVIRNITEIYKVQVCVLETDMKSELLQKVQQMMEQNSGSFYTTSMYLEAQLKTQLKQYESENEELKKTIKKLKEENKNQNQELYPYTGELRIVLLGKTGVGKSAAGNTILGKKVFREVLSSQSVTSVCQKESAEFRQRRVTVIDTPGLFDTNIDNQEIKKEIAKCVTMAAPGPHVFLLVLSLGRFTQEEKDVVRMIQDRFGEESRRYTMVLFTRGDDLQEMSIKDYIKDSDRGLQNIISQCGDRYHVFNNRNPKDQTQVTALLEKIDSMVAVNGGSCYTNEMFQQVEEALLEEQERILKEREEETEREKEELRAKHEAEMEKLRKTMEEEQQKQDEERKIREREFREREEQIRRESAERERIERENYNRRREEDEKRMKERMAEINREREDNRKQWEKQREDDQRRRDQEEEERRKKEEEWKKNQREEKEKFEREREEMIQKERDQQQKLQQEYDQKKQEEEKRRRDLEEKIKHSEESKRKELQELQLAQEREWERRKWEEEKRREEQEKRWRERMEFKEREWELQQNLKQQQFELERQIECGRRAVEEEKRKQREEEEKRRIEREANEKIQQIQTQMALQRETEAKEREEKYQKELEEKLKIQRERFQKEEEEKERARREEEERNLAYISEMHEEEKENLYREIKRTARRKAEREFCTKLDEKVKEAKTEGHREGYIEGEKEGQKKGAAEVEAKRTIPGKGIDAAVKMLWTLFKVKK